MTTTKSPGHAYGDQGQTQARPDPDYCPPPSPQPPDSSAGQAPGRLRPPVRWEHCSPESSTASVGCIVYRWRPYRSRWLRNQICFAVGWTLGLFFFFSVLRGSGGLSVHHLLCLSASLLLLLRPGDAVLYDAHAHTHRQYTSTRALHMCIHSSTVQANNVQTHTLSARTHTLSHTRIHAQRHIYTRPGADCDNMEPPPMPSSTVHGIVRAGGRRWGHRVRL